MTFRQNMNSVFKQLVHCRASELQSVAKQLREYQESDWLDLIQSEEPNHLISDSSDLAAKLSFASLSVSWLDPSGTRMSRTFSSSEAAGVAGTRQLAESSSIWRISWPRMELLTRISHFSSTHFLHLNSSEMMSLCKQSDETDYFELYCLMEQNTFFCHRRLPSLCRLLVVSVKWSDN